MYAALGHAHEHAAVVIVVNDRRSRSVQLCRELCAQTVLVVVIVVLPEYGSHCYGKPAKLLTVPQHALAPVTRGIAHAVIGDGLAVVAREQVSPLAVCVVVRRFARGGTVYVIVGIRQLVKDIAPLVIRIGVGGVIAVPAAVIQVFPDKLVCTIVSIGEDLAPLGYRGNITVCVVCIAISVIRAVFVGGNERGLGAVCAGNVGYRGVEDGAAAVFQLYRSDPADPVVGVDEASAVVEQGRLRAVIAVEGIGRCPARCPRPPLFEAGRDASFELQTVRYQPTVPSLARLARWSIRVKRYIRAFTTSGTANTVRHSKTKSLILQR